MRLPERPSNSGRKHVRNRIVRHALAAGALACLAGDDALQVNSAVGLADVLEDGEGLQRAALAEDEVAGAVLRHLGGVLLLAPAADKVLKAGGALDRHDGRDVGWRCELGAHPCRIAGFHSKSASRP